MSLPIHVGRAVKYNTHVEIHRGLVFGFIILPAPFGAEFPVDHLQKGRTMNSIDLDKGFLQSLGDRIRIAREYRKLSQEELAHQFEAIVYRPRYRQNGDRFLKYLSCRPQSNRHHSEYAALSFH